MDNPPGFEDDSTRGKVCRLREIGISYFLGIKVARFKEGIFISQRKYVLDLLKEIGMLGCKAVDTPMDSNVRLGDDTNAEPVNKGR